MEAKPDEETAEVSESSQHAEEEKIIPGYPLNPTICFASPVCRVPSTENYSLNVAYSENKANASKVAHRNYP